MRERTYGRLLRLGTSTRLVITLLPQSEPGRLRTGNQEVRGGTARGNHR